MLVAGLASSACSGGDGSIGPASLDSTSTSTSSAPESTTTSPESTTTVAPTTPAPATTVVPATEPPATTAAPVTAPATTVATTTTLAPSGCAGLPALGAGTTESASVLVDADADGITDTIRSYATSSSPVAGDWHVRVELAAGGGVDVALPDDPAPGAVKVLGGAYVGSTVEPGPGGMRPAIFVTTGSGASASIVTLFRLDTCNLVRMTVGGAGEATFAVGAGVVHAENLRCDGVAGTSVLAYQEIQLNADGVTFDVTDTGYTRTANDLVIYGAGPFVSNEPAMPAVATLIDCQGVEHP
jgi:hypothetical protein